MAKKVVDSWKSKSWYSIVSPKVLNEVEITQVPASDEEHLINRIIEIPLKEITRDISHMYYTVRLRVHEIKGKTAYTKFIGYSISREYLRTLVRRRRDALYCIFPCKSQDGIEFRMKVLVVTGNRFSESVKKALRQKATEWVKETSSKVEFAKFVLDCLHSKMPSALQVQLKKIAPIRRIEAYKLVLEEEFDVGEEEKEEKEEQENKE
jgi:small subunit ribosomal protein S3Ae